MQVIWGRRQGKILKIGNFGTAQRPWGIDEDVPCSHLVTQRCGQSRQANLEWFEWA
jgi:hypothetical protein